MQKIIVLILGLMMFFQGNASAKEIRLGIIPRRPAPITQKLFKPLADKLGEAIGMNVKIIYSKNFQSFVSDIKNEKFDIVHLGISHYLKAKKYGYRLLAKNEEFGHSTMTSVIYVRADSGINSLSDLKGKTIIFGGDKKSLIPYVAPTYMLWESGLKPSDYTGKVAQNPYNAIYAVYKGAGDAGCAADITLKLRNVKNKIKTAELKPLASLGPFPHLPWAASRKVDEQLFNKVQSFLLGLSSSEAGRKILHNAKLTDLKPVSDSEYDIVRKINKKFKQIKKDTVK